MTNFETQPDTLEESDPWLYAVLYGDKLVASVSRDEASDLSVGPDIEVVIVDADWLVVGKRISFSEALGERKIPDIRGYGERAAEIYTVIKDMTVAQADAYLYLEFPLTFQSPRFGSIESPEVTILEGLLNGFPDCCIGFYIDTRQYGMPEPEGYRQAFSDWKESVACTYLACPDCAGLPSEDA